MKQSRHRFVWVLIALVIALLLSGYIWGVPLVHQLSSSFGVTTEPYPTHFELLSHVTISKHLPLCLAQGTRTWYGTRLPPAEAYQAFIDYANEVMMHTQWLGTPTPSGQDEFHISRFGERGAVFVEIDSGRDWVNSLVTQTPGVAYTLVMRVERVQCTTP